MRLIAVMTLLLVTLLVATPLLAEGSLASKEVIALLTASPSFKPLASAYEFSETALGTRFGDHWRHLSGGRVGPYELTARTIHSSGPFAIAVIVCTEVVFTTQSGAVTDDPQQAKNFTEKVSGVWIAPLGKKSSATSQCPKRE
jgi:hypothetical protein